MTTHDMDPPSDIDVDLSSEAGSESRIESEASKILGNSKLYSFGSSNYNNASRRMDFSPTPSPPPPQFPPHGNNSSSPHRQNIAEAPTGFGRQPAPSADTTAMYGGSHDAAIFAPPSAPPGAMASIRHASANETSPQLGASRHGFSTSYDSNNRNSIRSPQRAPGREQQTAGAAQTAPLAPPAAAAQPSLPQPLPQPQLHQQQPPQPTPIPAMASVGMPPGPDANHSLSPARPSNGNDHEKSIESGRSSTRRTSSPAIASASTTPLTSGARTGIWVHFTRDQDYATNRRGRCVYCHNYYSCSSGSTGNMWRHIKRSHPEKMANAAPLATHGSHASAAKTESSVGPGSHETHSRPRKRQASFSSPSMERTAAPSLPSRIHNSGSAQASSSVRNSDESLLSNLTNAIQAVRNSHEDADVSMAGVNNDGSAASSDNIGQTLNRLANLLGKGQSNDRTQMQPQSSMILSLLDSISSIGGRGSGGATGNAGSGASPGSASNILSDLAASTRHSRSQGSGRPASLLPTVSETHVWDPQGSMSTANATAQLADAILAAIHYTAKSIQSGTSRAATEIIGAGISHTPVAGNSHPQKKKPQDVVAAFVEFMVRDLIPVEQMLSSGMLRLMESVSQGSEIPSAAVLTNELLRLKEAKTIELRDQLARITGRVAISIETGCINSSLSYLAVYAHWADSQFTRHSVLLDWRCTDGAVTSGDIIAIFEGTLSSYDLFKKLSTVTTSYTRELVDFLNQVETICHARGIVFDLNRNQATCIASTLLDVRTKILGMLYSTEGNGSTAVQSGNLHDSGVDANTMASDADSQSASANPPSSPVEKLNYILQRLQRIDSASRSELTHLCRDKNINMASLCINDVLSWASILSFLDSTLSFYSDIDRLVSAHAADANIEPENAMTADDWLSLSQVQVLLRIVDACQISLSQLPSEFPSIVEIVPIYDSLISSISDLVSVPFIRPDVRRIIEAVHEQLSQSHPFQVSPIYSLAPLFDPRVKKTYYTDRGYDQSWIKRVITDGNSYISEYAAPSPVQAPVEHSESHITSALRDIGALGAVNAQIEQFVQLGKTPSTKKFINDGNLRMFRRAYATGKGELDEYLGAPLVSPDTDIFAWWRANHLAFPSVGRFVREYISTPASSGAVSSILKTKPHPDYSRLVGIDKKLMAAYACLHHWQSQ